MTLFASVTGALHWSMFILAACYAVVVSFGFLAPKRACRDVSFRCASWARPASRDRTGFRHRALGNLFRPLPDERAPRPWRRREQQGFGYYDTAPFMASDCRSGGWATRVRRRKDIVLSTKVGRLLKPVPGPVDENQCATAMPRPCPSSRSMTIPMTR
jgi:hypothetical protein